MSMYKLPIWIKLLIFLMPDILKSRRWLLWEARDYWQLLTKKFSHYDFQYHYETIKIHMTVFEWKMKRRTRDHWLGYIFWQ